MRFVCYAVAMAFIVVSTWAFTLSDNSNRYDASPIVPSQTYDGDTIKDVEVRLIDCGDCPDDSSVFPGVVVKDGAVYAVFDLRINGIDTPEIRPSTRDRQGNKRSWESRMAEKQASLDARSALVDLLESNSYRFSVVNPKHGKYAGRIVADMFVGDTNVATYLIDKGLAKAYKGGRKPVWGF